MLGLIGLSFAAGLVLWPEMPDPMPSHWNAAGEVDGYMSRAGGLFLLPVIALGVFLLFLAIPRIDPLRANIAQFIDAYNTTMVLLVGYLLYIYALTLLWALGYQVNMLTRMMPAMGLLFLAVGWMVGRAKRNYFVGIRTPWTLSSDAVWARTHQLGKWMFIGAGVVMLLASGLGVRGFWAGIAAVLAAAFVPILYSYFLWKKEDQA
jgi:uncharacterized membrane protein